MKRTGSMLLRVGGAIVCLSGVTTTLFALPRFSDLPLSFERNRGQSPAAVEFLAYGNGYTLSLGAGEATLRVGEAIVSMRLEGSRRPRASEPLAKLGGTANYFVGKDPSRWRIGVPTYARVKYQSVYRGIDVVYYGKQRQLEYDFIVKPGAHPEEIRLRFEGAQALSVDSHGNLVVSVAGGSEPLRFQRPAIYQGHEQVAGGYVIEGSVVRFQVSAYDRARTLVIDPVLSYATYLGGKGYDQANAIAIDSTGAMYVAGYTRSVDFPTLGGLSITGNATNNKVFVAKLNPAGNALVYSTYLGGSGVDIAYAIAVDKAGNAYITGVTTSKDFPTVKPFQSAYGGAALFNPSTGDAFVAELNPSGSALVYSTFLGGTGSDQGSAIAVDTAGNIYLTGFTTSGDFPLANSLQPAKRNGINYTAFVTKLNAGGSNLNFSTYLGGGSSATYGHGIAIDQASNVYVTGDTFAYDFPVVNANQPTIGGGRITGNVTTDAFVTKLRADGGQILYSTFLGGSYFDYGRAIAVDASGNAFIAGETYSIDFPTLNAQQPALNGIALYQSLDGGANFSPANSGLAGANVTSIVVDPTNSLNVYAATSDRGIFSSSDGGNTWNTSGAGIQTSSVYTLAAAGTPPVLYAGLGSVTEFPVFRSTDGGATWNPSGTGLDTTYINTIVVDPSTPTTLYAGVSQSPFFYATTDGGDDWIPIDLGTPSPTSIWSIAVDPTNSANIYATTSSINGSTVYGVYKK